MIKKLHIDNNMYASGFMTRQFSYKTRNYSPFYFKINDDN